MTTPDDTNLQAELRALRAELDRSVARDSPARPRIEQLLQDLESHLEESGAEGQRQNLVGNLRTAVQHFEAEHPRATAIMNDIMVVLSNMGI
jgi:hypothetical protein